MKFRSIALVAAMLIGATMLTACTPSSGKDPGTHVSQESAFSSADIMFAQMMVPHHQQAVDMGTLAETRASNLAVKTLAARIKSEQTPEIAKMKGWLDIAGAGMSISDFEFTTLKSASGTSFDKLYLVAMIGHHEGAIVMAESVLNSKNSEVRALAEAIITSQTEQITYMKELLKSLG